MVAMRCSRRTVDERPTQDHWLGWSACSRAPGRGRIDKVVLARRVSLRSLVGWIPTPCGGSRAPESTTCRGGRTFRRHPWRLVRTEDAPSTVAVAGTIRRGAVRRDEQLGRALRIEKDRVTAVVVSSIGTAPGRRQPRQAPGLG
jgi:isochorismate synthase EntC